MDIIFATKNNGKVREIKEILSDTKYNVLSMSDIGLDIDVVEDGETFEDNAIKKAYEIMKATNKIVLADDSGLEIDFLDKKPGVHSARFLGEDTPYEVKNQKVLKMLNDVPKEKRTARFVSVIAACFPDGKILTTRGVIEGVINDKPVGENGFGYDPIFFVPEFNMTTAEMTLEQKNKISHRGKALAEMKQKLLEEI